MLKSNHTHTVRRTIVITIVPYKSTSYSVLMDLDKILKYTHLMLLSVGSQRLIFVYTYARFEQT